MRIRSTIALSSPLLCAATAISPERGSENEILSDVRAHSDELTRSQTIELRGHMRQKVTWLCLLLGAIFAPNLLSYDAIARSQELRISHQFAADVDSRDRAARVFIDETIKRAPHLRISLHPALSLKYKNMREQISAVLKDELAMCIYTLADLMDKAPEFAIAKMPFVPVDLDMAMRLKGTAFHRQLQSLAHANGLHILTWWWLLAGIASRQHEIGGPQTVKGLSVSLTGFTVYERMYELASGRKAVRVPTLESNAALHAGKTDGIQMTLETFVSFKTHESVKHATFGGAGNFLSMQPLLISKAIWDGLTVDEQYAMEEAADISDQYFYAQQQLAERAAIDAFIKAGVKIHKLSIDEYEAWARLAKDTIWPEYRKVSPVADRLFVALLTSIIQSGKAVR